MQRIAVSRVRCRWLSRGVSCSQSSSVYIESQPSLTTLTRDPRPRRGDGEEERGRGSVKLTRIQYVYRYLHSTALHLAGAGLERILQISDLETDVESFSPPPNDKLQNRPDLHQRVVRPLGGWRQDRPSSLRLHYRCGSTCLVRNVARTRTDD